MKNEKKATLVAEFTAIYKKHGVEITETFKSFISRLVDALEKENWQVTGDTRKKLWDDLSKEYSLPVFPDGFFDETIAKAIEAGKARKLKSYYVDEIPCEMLSKIKLGIATSGILSLPAEHADICNCLRLFGMQFPWRFAGDCNNKNQFLETLAKYGRGIEAQVYYERAKLDISNEYLGESYRVFGRDNVEVSHDMMKIIRAAGMADAPAGTIVAILNSNEAYEHRQERAIISEQALAENADLQHLEFVFVKSRFSNENRELPDANYNLLKADYMAAGMLALINDDDKGGIAWEEPENEKMLVFLTSMGYRTFPERHGFSIELSALLTMSSDFRLREIERKYGYNLDRDIAAMLEWRNR